MIKTSSSMTAPSNQLVRAQNIASKNNLKPERSKITREVEALSYLNTDLIIETLLH